MEHVSVLLREAVDALEVRQGGRYVDGTLGRAGHTREILRRGGEVLGIDRDDEAIAEVSAMGLKGLKIAKGEHGDLERIAHENGWDKADGVLLDLGVSSPQLDDAGRGFSFLREGPLDMRMDRTHGLSAADAVNGWSETELADVIWSFGEERGARRIAAAIVKARGERRIETTAELAEIVEKAIGRHGGHHPATRTFQALRMAVNDEMGELERALDGALRLVKIGGRIAVITFESLTDTAVKRRFAAHAGREVSLQGGGSRWEGERPRVRIVSRKAIRASEEEILANPRSRSAKLRVIEKEEI